MKRWFRPKTHVVAAFGSRAFRGIALLLMTSLLATFIGASIAPVRADVTSIAVMRFEDNASAPSSVVDALSDALYRAVAASPNYSARGGGPLAVKAGIARDPMGAQLDAAAGAGANQMLVGDIVGYGGSSVTFRLEAYRISPLALVRTRSFTHSYPPVNSEALSAALSADVASLEAPRAGTATIYMVTGKEIDADVGTADGFHIDQHFNVIRNGRKVAEATIVTIYDAYGVVDISNAAPGYHAAVGDRLVSQESQPALLPANNRAGMFEPIYFIVAAAAAIIAVAHKGSVAAFPSPSPLPSGSPPPFTVSGSQTGGFGTSLPTWTFTFSQPVSASSQGAMAGDTTSASWTITRAAGGTSSPATLGSLGPPTFQNAQTLVITDNNVPMQINDQMNFTFTANVTSSTGQHLTPTTISITRTSSAMRRPLVVVPPAPGGGVPGLPTGQQPGGGPHNPGSQPHPPPHSPN